MSMLLSNTYCGMPEALIMVIVSCCTQPEEELVIVTTYTPAQKLVAVSFVPPEGDQLKVYPETLPVTCTHALLLQGYESMVSLPTMNDAGCVMMIVSLFLQLLESLTVTTYVPGVNPVV